MEWLTDPSIWIGLATLVVLEIVLGIDNLIFIAILADKLPPGQRDKARLIGLSLALLMRLGLLSVMSWLITLTDPLFAVGTWPVSGRDLILLLGGLFLLFKATTELHERLEGMPHEEGGRSNYAGFWVVVAQIVILDAVFSLDAVITAVGMVNQLAVMMAAVVIAIGVMLLASKPLTRFVNAHPTVVVLCLSFLLMIGLSLVAEGVGFHIPKGYLYAAIGFSVVIEFFNQVARRNVRRHEARLPMRQRTADAVLGLLGGRRKSAVAEQEGVPQPLPQATAFAPEERNMVSGVLTLAERSVRSVMTPRADISWIRVEDDAGAIRKQVLDAPHSFFPVCRTQMDDVIGVARGKDLIGDILEQGHIDMAKTVRDPIIVHESIGILRLLETLRNSRGQLVLVTDEYGALQGVVTPVDILEAIAGDFPDEDEAAEIAPLGDRHWLMDGGADLHTIARTLEIPLAGPGAGASFSSLGGFLLAHLGAVPSPDTVFDYQGYRFTVVAVSDRRIDSVEVRYVGDAPAAG
ncbi:TerC family protein [Cupriavidus basilensis]|uniref:TerC family protein n=1 Tax=Cupriavidus basilensis TaxID=68895 RepID=A0ABT6B0A1_9BURK|nr:TerC family protein [Cupriavidus basilensis]MDF3838311.1 TerC family protein [Cupriavidus basilensis]